MGTEVLSDLREMAAVMKEAARIEIMPRFGRVSREEKQTFGRESVTEADRGSSIYVLERRRKKRPGSFSEEHLYGDRFLYDEVECYDTLDGTDEFIEGKLHGFAMHGALLKRPSPQSGYHAEGGVIYLPGHDTLWYAAGDEAHYELQGNESSFPDLPSHRLLGWVRALDITTNKHKFLGGEEVPVVPLMEAYYGELGRRLGLEAAVVPGGGSGASFSDLLSGKTNIILLPWDNSKEWDLSMAEPIIRARGGFVCDFAGNEYTYNREDVLNRGGYVASIVFEKEDIMPHLSLTMVMKS